MSYRKQELCKRDLAWEWRIVLRATRLGVADLPRLEPGWEVAGTRWDDSGFLQAVVRKSVTLGPLGEEAAALPELAVLGGNWEFERSAEDTPGVPSVWMRLARVGDLV